MRLWASGLAAAAVMASGTPASAEWLRAETDNFVVYGEGRQDDLRRHAESLERFDALMRRQFGIGPAEGARKLPVYLVHTRSELREIHPGLPETAAGFYSAGEIDVYSALNRRGGDDVLLHEYAHHFMYQNFPGAYPGWFVEGFAEFFMTATVENADAIKVGYFNQNRLNVLNHVAWIPMETLLTAHPRQLQQRYERVAFYSQSWLLTHYMLTDPDRRRGLDAYLAAVGRGAPEAEALKTHLGHDYASLEAALRAYLRGRMGYAEVDLSDVHPDIRFESLPASADRLLFDSLTIRYPKSPEEVRTLLPRVRADAARFPDDPLALTTLARAEFRWGDAEAGETALSRALSVAPADAEALQLAASRRITQSEAATDEAARLTLVNEARGYLARALETAPTDYRIYLDLARTRRGATGYPTENDLQTWRLATAYAPQVMSIRREAAQALTEGGRPDEARSLLQSVANDPHSEPQTAPPQTTPQSSDAS